MKRTCKKAFTIVELVIVIAVIAILAAVLIPTFTSLVRRANESSDLQLVRNLNTAVLTEGGATQHFDTAHDAIAAVERAGYDLSKIAAAEGDNKILWDANEQCFAYYRASSDTIEYVPDSKSGSEQTPNEQLWAIYRTMPGEGEQVYSVYWAGGGLETANVQDVGFDAGYAEVANVTYTGTSQGKEIVIRTNGGTLEVNGVNDCVSHYSHADEVTVTAVAYHSYHEYGTVGRMNAVKGRVVLEGGCSVQNVYVAKANASQDAEVGVKLNVLSNCNVKVLTDEVAQLKEVIGYILDDENSAAAIDRLLPAILVTGQTGTVTAYEDIAEALAKINDSDTVTLMKDVEYRGENYGDVLGSADVADGFNEYEEYGAYGVKGDNVTIDLNQKTLSLRYWEGGRNPYGSTQLSLNRYETLSSKRIWFSNNACTKAGNIVMGLGFNDYPMYFDEITQPDGSKTYKSSGIEESSSMETVLKSAVKFTLYQMMLYYDKERNSFAWTEEAIATAEKYLSLMGLTYEQYSEQVDNLDSFAFDWISDEAMNAYIADWTHVNNLSQLMAEFNRVFAENDDEFIADQTYKCLQKGHNHEEARVFSMRLEKTEKSTEIATNITMKNGTVVNDIDRDGGTTRTGRLMFECVAGSQLTFENVTFACAGDYDNAVDAFKCVMYLNNSDDDEINSEVTFNSCAFDRNAMIKVFYNDIKVNGSGNTKDGAEIDDWTPLLDIIVSKRT